MTDAPPSIAITPGKIKGEGGAGAIDPAGESNGPTLTVTTAGSGGGFVTSTPQGVSCGECDPGTTCGAVHCAAPFAKGQVVYLSAFPKSDSAFTGWSGACSGSGACNVPVDGAAKVTATFTKK